ncbi:MAG: response regulator [Chloroflexota bacterium]
MTKKVLMVDDDPRLRALVAATLGHEYVLLEASDGEQGLRLARQEAPDVVLLDVLMPGLNGIEVCRRLKNDSTTSHIKVIMLTGLDSDKDQDEAFRAGADDYFVKPFSPRKLLSKLSQVLG